MAPDASSDAAESASLLLRDGRYTEVGRVLASLRSDPATGSKSAHLDHAEQLLFECVRLRAESEQHHLAADGARRRLDLLTDEVVTILALTTAAADETQAQESHSSSPTAAPRPVTKARATKRRRRLAVHLLGEFEVFVDDTPVTTWRSAKSRGVLQLLVLSTPRPVSADALIDALWPGADADAGHRNLHQAMYMLRSALRKAVDDEADFVLFERPVYRLGPDVEVWSDVAELDRLAAAGRQAASQGGLDGLPYLEAAVGLYRGEFLADQLYEDWTFAHRDRLRRVFNDVATILLDMYDRLQRFDSLIELAHRVVEFDSCNELAHRHLIEAYDAQGLRHRAIRQFQICERELAESLGVDPSPETLSLVQRLYAHM